jgi:hypothetical protein
VFLLQVLQGANLRLKTEKGVLNKQLDHQKKKKDWEEEALSRLEEANMTVKKLFKLDAASRIRKDTIKEFFEKGNKTYTRIFDTISNFASDVDESLSDFSSALLSMRHAMQELSKELRNRDWNLSDSRIWRTLTILRVRERGRGLLILTTRKGSLPRVRKRRRFW